MRPYLPPPRRITEDGGSKGVQLPSDGGNGLDAPLPPGIVSDDQYADIGRELIADAKADAERAESNGVAYDPQPVKDFLAKHGDELSRHVPKAAIEELRSVLAEFETVTESFFPKRPRMTEQRLRKFADSLR